MRRQLSSEYSYLVPIIFFIIGVGVGTVLILLLVSDVSRFGRAAIIVIPVIIGFLAGYYSIRFCNVSFDSEYVYFSRFGRERKVSLDRVANIKVNVLPLGIFFLRNYIVTIKYTEVDQVKKAWFLSQGIFRIVGSVREIPHLDTLRKFIKDKKYGK